MFFKSNKVSINLDEVVYIKFVDYTEEEISTNKEHLSMASRYGVLRFVNELKPHLIIDFRNGTTKTIDMDRSILNEKTFSQIWSKKCALLIRLEDILMVEENEDSFSIFCNQYGKNDNEVVIKKDENSIESFKKLGLIE